MFAVVIPTYNRGATLVKCIATVTAQTESDYELIVVDNGSTDNTGEVVRGLAAKDPRIRYFYQENSGSPAGSRNTGIRHATRDWVAFLDSDDMWLPRKLERVKAAIKASNDPKLVAVSHWEQKVVAGVPAGVLQHGMKPCANPYEELLFGGNRYSTSAMVVKRTALLEVGLFDPRRDYFAVEDYDLWMKLVRIGTVAHIEDTLGEFHIGSDNMSSRTIVFHANLKSLVTDHIRELGLPPDQESRLLKVHSARVDYYQGRTHQKMGEFKAARDILSRSLKVDPWSLKKWVAYVNAIVGLRV